MPGRGFDNITVNNVTYFIDIALVRKERSISLAVVFIDIIVTTYILTVASLSSCRKHNFRSTGDSPLVTKLFNLSKIASATLILAYVVLQLPVTYSSLHPYCQVYNRIEYTLAWLNISLTYSIIWLRIYTLFYSNTVNQAKISHRLLKFSQSSIIYFALISVANLCLFFFSPTYASTDHGCLKTQNDAESTVRWVVYGITNIVFQVWLMFLLIYPMVLHHKQMHQQGFHSSTMLPLIKRAVVTCSVCIAANGMAVVVEIVNNSPMSYIRNAAFGTGLIISLIAVILTFDNWKLWLMPWHNTDAYERKKRKRSSNRTVTEQAAV